jgi:hypothetical protein
MELVGIERGGGTVTQSPGESREGRRTSERGRRRRQPVRIDRATGPARSVGLAPIGGPGLAGGPRMAVCERGEGVFLTRKLKNRN